MKPVSAQRNQRSVLLLRECICHGLRPWALRLRRAQMLTGVEEEDDDEEKEEEEEEDEKTEEEEEEEEEAEDEATFATCVC